MTHCKLQQENCWLKWLVALAVACCFNKQTGAQSCPANLDFEQGSFSGWTCYAGTNTHTNGVNNIQLFPSGEQQGRHTIFTRAASNEVDPYGLFPVVCPNGSGHSIRLGNDLGGTEAEGVSYEFTIPANRNEYSLIYHYAVVFQDPNHQPYEQPRLEIEISNITDNKTISCSSFTFYPVGSALPGFFESATLTGNASVWCKGWTAVSVNLDGLAGKTIRLFFKTADCTFRRHFGYAYVDVNSECSGEFTGATFCRGDSAVKVEAPHGYQRYTWSTNNFTKVLGQQQTLLLSPAPPPGTMLAVEVVPYDGYGCVDTLFARLIDTLTVKALAGNDRHICYGSPTELGYPPKPGIVYQWSPADGLTDSKISNPFADPDKLTSYILTSSSFGGGCRQTDTVTVSPVRLDNAMSLLGSATYCIGKGDSAVLTLASPESVQWYRNGTAIAGANSSPYRVTESGSYYARITKEGCVADTKVENILIEAARPGINYPVLYMTANTAVTLEARNFGTAYEWSPGSFLSATTITNPVFSGDAERSYTIDIRTAAGCLTVDTQTVKIVKDVNIVVPTAFTPNRDGRNDVLRPVLFGIKELTFFKIYNRWGQLLFQTTKANTGWDGRTGGQVQANQVVVWIAEGIGIDGKRYTRKGTAVCIQ